MISRMLILTDGSQKSQTAAKYAVGLAQQLKASIIVLSVIDHRTICRSMPRGTPVHLRALVEERLRETAEGHAREVEQLCEEIDVPSRSRILIGDAAEEIMNEAKRSNKDLIVICAYESRNLAASLPRRMTDSNAPGKTNIPVLLVRQSPMELSCFLSKPQKPGSIKPLHQIIPFPLQGVHPSDCL